VTLAHVEMGRDKKLVLTTSDGAVWRPLETDPILPTPVEGQTMTIEKTIFGGFFCKPSKHAAFRCIRGR
jgi:hypothetical protein